MQARGPLMVEHRLIERMIAVVRNALDRIRSNSEVAPQLVEAVVDFIRVYADRTHHGKEEDVLFRELDTRSLSAEDRRVMEELLREHVIGREITQALSEAGERHRHGDKAAPAEIAKQFQKLVDLYPRHIDKEDNVFFPASRAYFTEEEEQSMLAEFREYDRKMIHEKYTAVVKGLETSA